MRRLALAALDWTRKKDPPLSLGSASIIANLKKHDCLFESNSWAVNDSSFDFRDVIDWVMDCEKKSGSVPLDFGIGAFVWNELETQSILTELKHNGFKGRIIVGGPQVSYVNRNLEQYYPQADLFVRGYAESPLVELFRSTELQPNIPGIHYTRNRDEGLSASNEFHSLPSPFLDGIIPPQRFIRWESQRGCPFKCSFCQHRSSNEQTTRNLFALNRIHEEIKWICSHPVIQDIAVLDPTFNSGPNYLESLELFANYGYQGKLSLQCRLEMVKPEFLAAVKRLNDQGANCVLEFGVQTIHKNEQKVINRPNNLKTAEKVTDQCHDLNIQFEISMIFGLPEQTVDSFQQSVDWAKQRCPTKLCLFPLMLLRGTPLYERKDELQLVEGFDTPFPVTPKRQTERICHVVSSPSFTYDDWKRMGEIAALHCE